MANMKRILGLVLAVVALTPTEAFNETLAELQEKLLAGPLGLGNGTNAELEPEEDLRSPGDAPSGLLQRSTRGYSWVGSGNGEVPPQAVVGGRTANGETLYVGRVFYRDDLIPGKVHPSHRRLYISYRGREYGFGNYEVLVEL